MARGDASAASGGGFRAIGASSARTSFSLGLVSLRSASKVRAESVRSGPCEAKIGVGELGEQHARVRAPSEKAK